MRVAHIIKVTRISGAERHLLLLLGGLRAADVDARLVILVEKERPMEDMMQEARQRGIPARRLVISRDYDLGLTLRLRRTLRQIQPDLVHTHLIHADLFGWLAAKLAGVRAVVSSRHNDDQFRYHPLWRRISPWLWKMTSAGIAISAAIKNFSVEIEGAPANKVQVTPYGMEYRWITDEALGEARANLIAELGLASDVLLLGMVCRIVEQKGIIYALQAFNRLQDRFPEARLVIAGDGELTGALKASSRELGIAERVHWLGWRTDAADLIGAFDILLLPSLWEGFGLVLLEAMSRRVPVIASRVSAIPEVVVDGETGILVEARDAPALADAMGRLLEDRALRQHMGLLGAARLEEQFSIERTVSGTLEVYRKALH